MVDWIEISKQGNLSEEFIRENKNHLHWETLLINQQFHSYFLEEMKDIVDWMSLSKYQNINKDFIYKHLERVYFYLLEENKQLNHITKAEWDKMDKDYEDMLETYIHLDIGSVREVQIYTNCAYVGRIRFVKEYEKLKQYSSFQIQMTCLEDGEVHVRLHGLDSKTKVHNSIKKEDMFTNKKEEERLKGYVFWFLRRIQYESTSIIFS